MPAPTSRMRSPRPSGRCARRFLHRRGDGREPVAGEQAVAVELIEQLRAGAGEQHLHGVLFAAQDRAEFGAISRAEQRFGKMAGMLRDEVAQRFRRRNPRRVAKAGVGSIAASTFFAASRASRASAIKRSKTGRIGAATPQRIGGETSRPASTPISRSPCASCAAARSSLRGNRSLQVRRGRAWR